MACASAAAVAAPRPVVTVSVVASDPAGNPLHYRWRSTDGQIQDSDSPSTTWALPAGPGLHFAYVLVSNGVGGYTERRLAVNTDSFGVPIPPRRTRLLRAPPSPPATGDFYRSFVSWDNCCNVPFKVYQPDVLAYVQDQGSGVRFPATGNVLSSEKGEVIIPGVPAGGNYTMNCSVDHGRNFYECLGGADGGAIIMDPAATTDYAAGNVATPIRPLSGSVKLADGAPCGTFNEFFNVHVTATATLIDRRGRNVAGPVRVNEFGDYSVAADPRGTEVLLRCERAAPIRQKVIAGTTDLGTITFAGVSAPTVSGMAASFNGVALAAPLALFLPPPSGFPSDIMPRADGYLAVKGLDSRQSACQYYKAVGAIQGCDKSGNFVGAVTFDDWRRAVRIGEYAPPGTPTATAAYINKVDLNLARVHEAITYGDGATAGVVCNHLGPPAGTPAQLMNPSQAEVDTAVSNAVTNKNLVACVAMDYSVTPGVNGDQPFTRFLIFGPSGELLPSINLDGRREKFVPGTCVVCHGGDHYAGRFPENGAGSANVGAHFLPYDVGNFEFSSQSGLREEDQAPQIKALNQITLSAGPTQAEKDLVNGWYGNPTVFFDKDYVPPSWQATADPTALDFYKNVNARSCRTCHVAMTDGFNLDEYTNVGPWQSSARYGDASAAIKRNVCGGGIQTLRNHMMPNSLITFNRMWLSSGTSSDQIALLQAFYANAFSNGPCPPPAGNP